MVNGQNGQNGQFVPQETKGEYFTVGNYIAIKNETLTHWRISKVATNGTYDILTITLVEMFTHRHEAHEWLIQQESDTTKTDI